MGKRALGLLSCLVWLAFGCMSGGGSGSGETSEKRAGIGDGEIGSAGGGSGGGLGSPSPGVALDAAEGPSGGSASGGAPAGSGVGSDGSGASAPLPPSDPSDFVSGPSVAPASGVLTAGAWDDNLNFDRFSDFREQLIEQATPGLLPTSEMEHAAAFELWSGAREARTTLDVSLVVDTTGSMGDELAFLQTELLAISRTIEALHPDAAQRWSLVVYKDEGDEYVVRWFDFRDRASEFRDKLAEQSAGGGGDFPEAPDQALAAMSQLAWRQGGSTARLAFWVADAPHHDDRAEAMAEAIRAAAEQDIHVYPVASSGIDKPTELSMRAAAQLTGGRYLFLTDDSGVGGAHLEPSIPCYYVTRLDDAIVRMVDIELSGEYREPEQAQILRTGGDPDDRACRLESGEELLAF